MHCIASHCIFAYVSCIASFFFVDVEPEVAYELVAEPVQELPAGDQQPGEAVEPAPEEITNPADLQGRPRSISLILNTLCFT